MPVTPDFSPLTPGPSPRRGEGSSKPPGDGLVAGEPVRVTALALQESWAQVKRWRVEVHAILAGALRE